MHIHTASYRWSSARQKARWRLNHKTSFADSPISDSSDLRLVSSKLHPGQPCIHTQPATDEVLPTVTELDDDMASWQLNPKISFTEQYEIGAVVAEVPEHLHLPVSLPSLGNGWGLEVLFQLAPSQLAPSSAFQLSSAWHLFLQQKICQLYFSHKACTEKKEHTVSASTSSLGNAVCSPSRNVQLLHIARTDAAH